MGEDKGEGEEELGGTYSDDDLWRVACLGGARVGLASGGLEVGRARARASRSGGEEVVVDLREEQKRVGKLKVREGKGE